MCVCVCVCTCVHVYMYIDSSLFFRPEMSHMNSQSPTHDIIGSSASQQQHGNSFFKRLIPTRFSRRYVII